MTTGYLLPPAPPDQLAPVIDFDSFMTYEFDWRQNQHVGIIGPTDQGKTNLAYHLLTLRSYAAYFAIKTEDRTLDAFAGANGYHRFRDWPPQKQPAWLYKPYTWEQAPRRLVWPDASDRRGARLVQQRVFTAALDDIWASGRAAVVWDDFWYLVQILKMELDAKQNLLNARSCLSAQILCAQRGPGTRTPELFDQPTWLFFFREGDPDNLRRIGGVGTANARAVRAFTAHLQRFQALAVNTRDGRMWRVTAPELKLAA